MDSEYKPGDVLIKERLGVETRRLTVADPPFTSRGKLRLINKNGSVVTTWWGPANNYWLPPQWRRA